MIDKSNFIYDELQKQIAKLIEELVTQNSDEKITQDIDVAINNLNILNDQIQKEYEDLKRLSEWKRFTIAFYGETNAGKSTLIEALRLLLKEPTKLENQRQFKMYAEKSGVTQEAFDNVRQKIMETEQAILLVEKNLQEINQKYAKKIVPLEVNINRLTGLLSEIKEKQNFWQRLISWFSPPKEKAELIAEKQALIDIQEEKSQEFSKSNEELNSLKETKKNAENENERLLKEAEKLKQFADGQIIGDGRSDFTRDNTSFDFNYNRQEFSLIDVPGIEGDEDIVRQPIEEAVKKAHAVFYVTRTPRPPQTHEGEQGKKGTLEKIKEHLDAQTEVWTIYNHAVNNPRQLKAPLIGKGEEEGLRALDDKLKQELAEQYCKSLVVSARPAYLGLTECVVPGSKESSDQRKFLEHFASKQEILALSGLNNFVEKLSTEIIGDYQHKIKRSNFNKASKVLDLAISDLSILSQKFNEGRKEIRKEVENAQKQIKVLLTQFESSLTTVGSKIMRNFENAIRKKIYDEIELDISNDRFKTVLKEAMEDEGQIVESTLQSEIKKEIEEFEIAISNIIKRSNHHLNNIVAMQNNSFKSDKFDMDIQIDSGVKWLNLLASGAGLWLGVVALASNPVGWTFAFVGGALALVGAVIGVAKSVFGFFSSSYKQSQQRKEADKAIRNAKSQIENEIDKILTKIKQGMNEQIQPVIEELETPLKQYNAIIKVLSSAKQELQLISQRINY